MNSLTVEQIQEIIPHRHPFLLLDRIEDYEPGQYAVGYKAVTYREDFFRGHFPPGGSRAGDGLCERQSGCQRRTDLYGRRVE